MTGPYIHRVECDILIIGGGMSGCGAALTTRLRTIPGSCLPSPISMWCREGGSCAGTLVSLRNCGNFY